MACAASMNPPAGPLIVSEAGRKAIQEEREKKKRQRIPSIRCALSGLTPLSGARLLLRHAMERAEAEYEVAAGDADDLAVGKQSRQLIQSEMIARIIKSG